jgi:hypothetical protein
MELFEVEYWINTPDGYDNRYKTELANCEQEAIEIVKRMTPRGKNFKIFKP